MAIFRKRVQEEAEEYILYKHLTQQI